MALLSLETIRDAVRTDPSLFFQNLDFARGAILVLRLDASAIRAASFLDDRILTPQSEGRWVGFDDLAALFTPRPSPLPLHFIFHSGHVGSTLISRLLDDVGGVLGLREPLPLRVLSQAQADLGAAHALLGEEAWTALLEMQIAGWARGFPDTRAVVVKATSSAAVCCDPLLNASPGSKALHLNLRPEPYLATLLAGENTPLDLRGQAQARMKRLAARVSVPVRPLHTLGLGEIAAMSWAVETLTHCTSSLNFSDRVLRIDFDDFLAAPGQSLHAICSHFGLDAPGSFFETIGSNPTLTRYSKAPEHAYTPQLRGEILTASRARNGEEIRRGMAWLAALARDEPQIAEFISA